MSRYLQPGFGQNSVVWGRFRKRNLKHAKECSIQQRRGFACGVCRWKRRFGCSRNSAVSAARFESGFRERDGQGQHWRGPHSHGGFLKMIVCESGGHANGLTYFIFRFLRRPHEDHGAQDPQDGDALPAPARVVAGGAPVVKESACTRTSFAYNSNQGSTAHSQTGASRNRG